MALQTKILGRQVAGIVGEFSDTSVKSARQYLTYGVGGTADPQFGKLFAFVEKTIEGASVGTVAQQGAASGAKLMGILVNPKEHYIVGFNTGRSIANGTAAMIATRGHVWVFATDDVTAGGKVYTDNDGNLYGTATGHTEVKGAQWLKTTDADFQSNYAAYDSTAASYAVGDKVKVVGADATSYYQCKTAITEASSGAGVGEFDEDKWTEVNPVAEQICEVAIDTPSL